MVATYIRVILLCFVFSLAGPITALSACRTRDGQPKLCFPPQINIASLPSVQAFASSTCSADETYCFVVPALGQPSRCLQCRAIKPGGTSPHGVAKVVDGRPSTRWQSSPLRKPDDKVVIQLQATRRFTVFSITLNFAAIGRPRHATVEVSGDGGRKWRSVAVVSVNCTHGQTRGNAARLKCHHINRTGEVEVTLLDLKHFIASLDNASALEEIFARTSLDSIRLVFSSPENFSGGREVARNPQVSTLYRFYALAEIGVWGFCQCGGHADACLTPQGTLEQNSSPRCVCQHGTAGPECSLCNGLTLTPARHPATRSRPDPCEGTSSGGTHKADNHRQRY